MAAFKGQVEFGRSRCGGKSGCRFGDKLQAVTVLPGQGRLLAGRWRNQNRLRTAERAAGEDARRPDCGRPRPPRAAESRTVPRIREPFSLRTCCGRGRPQSWE